jgi:hypothetical protein
MSYTIVGEFNGLDYSQLRALLSEANKFIEKPVSEKVHISFGTFNTTTQTSKAANYDPAFIKQYAAIKNVLTNHNVICDKTILFKTIEKLIPMGIKFLPKTYTIDTKLFDSPNGKIFILKKKDMAAQTGVRVITSKIDFENAKKELHLYDNAIISEYITNPLTIDGKKFHLRVYFLLSSISGIIRCCSHNEYRILTAELPYIAGDWSNKKIHLSGGHYTKKRYIWPNDFDSIINTTLKTNLEECKNVLCLAMASSNIKNYPESDAGYHLYAGANGIKKCFALNTSHIITAKNKYSIEKESDWNNQDIDYPKYGTTDKIYDLKSAFSDLKSHDLNSESTIDNIHSFIQQVANLVVESDFIPFPESNAGFTNFVILAKFIQSANNTYTPIIDQIFNNTQIHNLQISNKENEKLINDFSKEFYSIIKDGIICPHFGINTHSLQRPNAIHSNNKLIDAKLISELYLEFNSNRDNIKIYINGHQCGHIKLDLKLEDLIVNLSHIEIDAPHRRKKIALHSIFILMDILAAYYAPDIISLQFNSDFIAMHSIAYKLNFQTTSLEKKSHIFIRLCRSIDN